jgi:16S rRNA G966 N2-methylase RsmD
MDINKNILESVFPEYKGADLSKMKIDEEGLYSISSKNVSKFVCNIIKKYIRSTEYENMIITDATAGVGGNTISFLLNYGIVNTVEFDSTRFNYLKNNICNYKLQENCKFFCNDYTKIYDQLNQDIVFIDPPWGGKDYKNNDLIDLKLSNVDIATLCNNLKTKSKLIVLKVPQNFNFKKFYSSIIYKFVHIHKLNKMDIIVIENYGN